MSKRGLDSILLGSEDSHSSGDDTEDDDDRTAALSDDDGAEKINLGNESKEGDASAPELLVKKKQRKGKNFDETMVCGPDGLRRIYQEFPKIFKFRGKNHEAADLKKLTGLYIEWAFQLYSGLAFEDLLKSVRSLSSKGAVKSHMELLRETERDRYLHDVFGITIPRAAPAAMSSPERPASGNYDFLEDTPTGGGRSSTPARTNVSVDPFDNEDMDAAIWEELERKALEQQSQQQSQSSQFDYTAIGSTPQEEEVDMDFEAAMEEARRVEMDRLLDSYEADALLTQ